MVVVRRTGKKVCLYSISVHPAEGRGQAAEGQGPVTDLVYSHNYSFLALCKASKVVTIFSVAKGYLENNVFCRHHAKIISLA